MHARARRHTLMLLDTLFIFTVYWNFPCTYLSTGGLQSHTLKHFFLIQLYHQMEWSAKRTFINRSTNQSIHLKKNRKRKKERVRERERDKEKKKPGLTQIFDRSKVHLYIETFHLLNVLTGLFLLLLTPLKQSWMGDSTPQVLTFFLNQKQNK